MNGRAAQRSNVDADTVTMQPTLDIDHDLNGRFQFVYAWSCVGAVMCW